MDNHTENRKVWKDCNYNPHCPAVKYISDDAIFVDYGKKINYPFRINLGDTNICDYIGRIWHYKTYCK